MILPPFCSVSLRQLPFKKLFSATFCALLALGAVSVLRAQQMTPSLFQEMRWRLIGPFRGGCVSAVAGIPNDTRTYYMGTMGGGVWKTTDGGVVWKPISSQIDVASIGAVAVAASSPNVVYVGTGQETQHWGTIGDGVYKSVDGGKNWRNIGLRATHYTGAIVVDPNNPDIVLVAAAGDTSPSAERGVYKSTDGGKSWTKVLYKNDMLGAMNLAFEPENSNVVYATLMSRKPRNFFEPPTPLPSQATDTGVYKSTDEGTTWTPVRGGLPTGELGRIGLSVAPGGRIVYARNAQGLFRSDDSGVTWKRPSDDPRIFGRGDGFSEIALDPRNPDTIYVTQTSLYRSTDGGKTFTSFKGAPGGDDYREIWVNPKHPDYILLGVDQGATISVDGGVSWNSWYNQPTGQFYTVSTDNAFPYRVYGAQQDSGTAGVLSRSDFGQIRAEDWYSVSGFEKCYIVPDPLNTDIVYVGSWYGSIMQFHVSTGQATNIFLSSKDTRVTSDPPLAFLPYDQHTLLLGTQQLLKTSDGGLHWQPISPDLTVLPGSKEKIDRRTFAIATVAPSKVKAGEIWIGTANGLIQLTQDAGKSWKNVTPPEVPHGALINMVEASPFDAGEAYASVNGHLDPKAYLYRTRDYGETWQAITTGLPSLSLVRVAREDPKRKGLLYAGTETGAFVSFDDGDHWQSLQLNLPMAAVRDLTIHGDDLAAATFGRALWILDDLTPLRQAQDKITQQNAYLYTPETAIRWRWDNYQDTPLQPEIPAAPNPPVGVIVDYFLRSTPSQEITLSVFNTQGKLVRQFSSKPQPASTDLINVPDYWFAAPVVLSTQPGMHRIAWDMRLPDPPALNYAYTGQLIHYMEYTLINSTVPGRTPRAQPQGPIVPPGKYNLVLTVDGKQYSRTVDLNPDPRVHLTQAAYEQQFQIETKLVSGMATSYAAFNQLATLQLAVADRDKQLANNADAKDAVATLQQLETAVKSLTVGTTKAPGFGPVNRDMARIESSVEGGDTELSTTAVDVVNETCASLDRNLTQMQALVQTKLPATNDLLKKSGVAELELAPLRMDKKGCNSQ